MKADGDNRESGRNQRSWSRRCCFNEERRHKYICVCTEGTETEKSYLDCIESVFKKERKKRGDDDKVQFCLVYAMNKKTAPKYLLKKVERKLESLIEEKGGYDSAWIISDYDAWKQEDLEEIEKWSKNDVQNRRWILSNENIEYWFALHFQKNGDYQAFKKRYNKRILNNDFTYEQIVDACKKARAKKQELDDLYTQHGSLMYKIVEYIGKEYRLCFEDSKGRINWVDAEL